MSFELLKPTTSGIEFLKGNQAIIAGIALERQPTNPITAMHLREVNEDYQFPEVTKGVLRDIAKDRNCLLIGHSGTGKTSLIFEIAARINQPVRRINLDGQITVSELLGRLSSTDGNIVWIDGILPYCMRNGIWLIVDELDFGDPAILAGLHGVLEGDRQLVLNENGGEVVKAHPNFRFFATANSIGRMSAFRHLYQGTNIMNNATVSRWGRLHYIDYMDKTAEAVLLKRKMLRELKVDKSTKKFNDNLDNLVCRLVNTAKAIREAFLGEQIACTLDTRILLVLGETICEGLNAGDSGEVAVEEAMIASVYNRASVEDAKVMEDVVQRFLGLATKK
jgi:cobaltochelatase CobS